MDNETRSEVRHEVQNFLASTGMFAQPEGKVELTPVAQKAMDRYLFRWISTLATLSTAAIALLGFVGFVSLTETASLTAEVAAQSAVKAAEDASEKATSSLVHFQDLLKTSEEELVVSANETKDEIECVRAEAGDIRLELENDRIQVDKLRKQLESELAGLRLRSNEFNNELIEKRAEWDAIGSVEVLQGAVEKIAAEDRILRFIADRMALNALPVGSIVGWHKNFPGAPSRPPNGWVECSGAPDLEQYPELKDSKFDLSEIPNLNDPNKAGFINGYAGGAFLRGGTRSGAFERDSTKRPNAAFTTANAQGGHSHTVPAGDTGSPIDSVFQNGGNGRRFSITVGGGNHGHSITGGGDPETRPVNMSVVWIIRVK